jgi:hypothetical protein
MDTALIGLRQALSDLALPAAIQLGMFDASTQAVTQLKRRYESAHAHAEASRNTKLSAEQRQALDEFLWDLTAHYAFEEGIGGGPPVDSSTDEFLQESEFWADIRLRAQDLLSLLNNAKP